MLGWPFSFAHHFMAQNTLPALKLYRETFRPSECLAEPEAMVAVAVICADDDDTARYLSRPARLSMARLRAGRPSRMPSNEEAAAHQFSEKDEAKIRDLTGSAIVGGPETVRRRLEELAAETQADELMITTMVYEHSDRTRSYELVAELAGLRGESSVPRTPA